VPTVICVCLGEVFVGRYNNTNVPRTFVRHLMSANYHNNLERIINEQINNAVQYSILQTLVHGPFQVYIDACLLFSHLFLQRCF
jgi:hypothetical protein